MSLLTRRSRIRARLVPLLAPGRLSTGPRFFHSLFRFRGLNGKDKNFFFQDFSHFGGGNRKNPRSQSTLGRKKKNKKIQGEKKKIKKFKPFSSQKTSLKKTCSQPNSHDFLNKKTLKNIKNFPGPAAPDPAGGAAPPAPPGPGGGGGAPLPGPRGARKGLSF